MFYIIKHILAHLSRRLKGELIVYQSSRRLCVCVSGCVSVDIFKLEYLCNQWANRNEILSEPSLGWGKGCTRYWARSDRNSGVHGNEVTRACMKAWMSSNFGQIPPPTPELSALSEKLMYNVVNTSAPLFLIGSSSFLQVRRTTIKSRPVRNLI